MDVKKKQITNPSYVYQRSFEQKETISNKKK
jgi:hypothetical protein